MCCDTKKACQDLGYAMIAGADLYPNWTPTVEIRAVELTDLGKEIVSHFNGRWFWLTQTSIYPWHIALQNSNGNEMANNSYYTPYDTSYTRAFCKKK